MGRQCCCRFARWLPAIAVIIIFFYSYYAFGIHLCIFTIDSIVKKVLYMIVHYLLLLMTAWCFIAAAEAKSIPVPPEFYVSQEDLRQWNTVNPKVKMAAMAGMADKLSIRVRSFRGEVRYCEHCKCLKPDRTHHCSVCNRCIVQMDHHCPWINNCVHFKNRKYFFLLVVYALLLSLFVFGASLEYFIKFFMAVSKNEKVDLNDIHTVIGCILAFGTSVCLLSLFILHVILIKRNRSTLECFQQRRHAKTDPATKTDPYDRGGCNNFKSVFGNNYCLWLFPVFTALGDGVHFEMDEKPRHIKQSTDMSAVDFGGPVYSTQSLPVQPQTYAAGDRASVLSSHRTSVMSNREPNRSELEPMMDEEPEITESTAEINAGPDAHKSQSKTRPDAQKSQ